MIGGQKWNAAEALEHVELYWNKAHNIMDTVATKAALLLLTQSLKSCGQMIVKLHFGILPCINNQKHAFLICVSFYFIF